MVEVQRITEPSLLCDITVGLSNLDIETSRPSHSGPHTRQAELVLLQPLANAAMLAACRNPDSCLLRQQNGFVCGTSNNETLNIRPLSVAWRQAVSKVAPISQVTFDLSLPKKDEDTSAFKKVYWETATPQEGGLFVRTQDVINLVITLATETRMRANGNLQFGVTYDKTEGIPLSAMTRLKAHLLALAEYKAPVKDKEQGD